MKALFLFLLFVSMTACIAPSAIVDCNPDARDAQPESDSGLTPIRKECSSISQTFVTPGGWYFQETKLELNLPREPKRELLLTNTDRKIFLGAILPDNYNAEEYAQSFIAIKALVYEDEVDFEDLSWQDFFADFYPEVESFEVQTMNRSNLQAVMVSETDGVWLGEKRIFIRAEERFYDISLHIQQADRSEAEAAWNNFLNNYDF